MNSHENLPLQLSNLTNLIKIIKQKLENIFLLFQRVNSCPVEDSALHLAVRNGNEEDVEKLLQEGADVNVCNDNGSTPLHYAVKFGYPDLVKHLMLNGANPKKCDNYFRRPFHMLSGCPKGFECLDALLHYDVDLDHQEDLLSHTTLQLLIMNPSSDINVILRLLEIGSDPNITNCLGCNALHHLTDDGNDPHRNRILAEALIEHGVDVNAKSDQGNTPLHCAAEGSPTVVEILLRKGVDFNELNEEGMTAFEVAMDFDNENVLNVFIKFFVLRKHCGLYVNKETVQYIEANERYREVRVLYENELESLKLLKLPEAPQLTYYDVLCRKNIRRKVVKNSRIRSGILKNPLPVLYKRELIASICIEMNDQYLAKQVYAHLRELLPEEMPDLCIQKISEFIDPSEMNMVLKQI